MTSVLALLGLLLPAAAPGAWDLAERIDAERMARTVRALVELGARMGGTSSGHRAAAWRAERFRAAGLAVEVREDPPRWCHETRRFELRAEANGEPLELGSVHPLGFSPTAEGAARLALAPEPGGAWLAAEEPERNGEDGQPAVALVDGATSLDGAWPVVSDLPGEGPFPYPVFGIGAPAGRHLRAALETGAVEVRFAIESEIRRAAPRTVVARLDARDGAPEGHLLVCAHGDSDSGGPGANDNGSGEAIVLELARAWAGAVEDGTLPPPPREVRFAIWGTEIHSSRAYLRHARASGETILGVVNFDQSGYGSGADRLFVEPDDLPANATFVDAFAALLEKRAGTAGFPEEWATVKSLGGTDSYVFSADPDFRANGRPAVTIYVSAWGRPARVPRTPGRPGASWTDAPWVEVDHDLHYHTSGDLPHHTTDREPHTMAWCARTAWLTALTWLEEL